MLRRAPILSLIATLIFLLSGECCASGGEVVSAEQATPLQVAMTLDDAEFETPNSLLSGQSPTRPQVSNRRVAQRPSSKRSCGVNMAVRVVPKASLSEYLRNSLNTTLLGGVVADMAFYSLCCLRI
ncbi:MAG: hypothetical protein IKL20_02790 [Alistipes sp.]|nr:hypothetical protein [Alistipes sp.]